MNVNIIHAKICPNMQQIPFTDREMHKIINRPRFVVPFATNWTRAKNPGGTFNLLNRQPKQVSINAASSLFMCECANVFLLVRGAYTHGQHYQKIVSDNSRTNKTDGPFQRAWINANQQTNVHITQNSGGRLKHDAHHGSGKGSFRISGVRRCMRTSAPPKVYQPIRRSAVAFRPVLWVGIRLLHLPDRWSECGKARMLPLRTSIKPRGDRRWCVRKRSSSCWGCDRIIWVYFVPAVCAAVLLFSRPFWGC